MKAGLSAANLAVMRAFLTSIVAVTVAISGLTVASLVLPTYEGSAQAQKAKAKTSKKPAERRSSRIRRVFNTSNAQSRILAARATTGSRGTEYKLERCFPTSGRHSSSACRKGL